MNSTIVYTKTDEAPALATYSLLPIIQAFCKPVGIQIDVRDISLAARILAQFSDQLPAGKKVNDDLAYLGELAKKPEANIIKLPNISASIPQLKAAIQELQKQGFTVPDYPENPQDDAGKAIQTKYSKVLGSAVNPVLREGNSDRRVAKAVKEYARTNPHQLGAWSKDSKTHVAHMQEGDFYGSEKSSVVEQDGQWQIVFTNAKGEKKILKEKVSVKAKEVVDASFMSCEKLRAFYQKEMDHAKKENVLLSFHLKATMMKISDPIIFGEAVKVYFKEVLEKYKNELKEIGFDARNGLGDLYQKLSKLPAAKKSEIELALEQVRKNKAELAMVDSEKGISNLHFPNDVIVDASMPAAIKSSGKMWGKDGKLYDTKAIIPDRCYAGIYQETINFCKQFGAFNVKTMGSVSNVGLMAQKAEEYGSHDKTFWITEKGVMQVLDQNQKIKIEHAVEAGDIWRMCQTKEVAIVDWVKLAVKRAKATNHPAIFWLDAKRSHDQALITKVNQILATLDTKGLEIQILSPVAACAYSLKRLKEGQDTISVTGNVLRDYLTDLFPILELGTSAKMLSIVPLLDGGGLFETGAGGSAPKHVQQLVEENYLRWDSLGEFLAIAVSLEDLGDKKNNEKIKVLAETLDRANGLILKNDKSPARKVGELDNRGSHFFLAYYWAQELATQNKNSDLKKHFEPIAQKLKASESKILAELLAVQGQRAEIGGHYHPNDQTLTKVMRPSATFNQIIAQI